MDVFFETLIEGSTQTDKILLGTFSQTEAIEFIEKDMEQFCNKNSLKIPTVQSNKTYQSWGRTFTVVFEVGSFRWSIVKTIEKF